ncbi:MFS transporter [Promicromonospora xylanilytica]
MNNSSPPQATAKSWAGLAVLVLPLLLITIDSTVLILGLPAISAELRPTGIEQLWMIDIYSLVLAGLLVAMSTVGDRFGRRRNLLIGAVIFAAASMAGALATAPWMLIGARALLGVGGAIMMPSTLSLVRNMFLDRQQRRYAMAVWAAMASAGAAVGPILGGWVIETFSWQAAFLLNIPVMLLLLILGPILLPESRNPALRRIDIPSVVLSFAGMVGVVYAVKSLTGGKDVGLAMAALVIGLTAIVLFVRRQLRLPTPLMDVRLFKVRYFRGAVIADLLSIFAMVGALVALVQHLQLVLGLNPLQASVWLIPQAIFATIAAFLAAVLVKRILPAYVITVGLLIAAVGFGLTIFLTPTSSPVLIATALALVALGAGMGLALSNDIIMSSVRPERAGQAAATSETAYEIGTTLGTAVLGGVLVSWYTRVVAAGTDALALTSGHAERASSTMAEALLVATEVGGSTGAAVLEIAKAAFTDAITITGAAGAGVMVLAAIWALVMLRGAAANKDLAAEHEHELRTAVPSRRQADQG